MVNIFGLFGYIFFKFKADRFISSLSHYQTLSAYQNKISKRDILYVFRPLKYRSFRTYSEKKSQKIALHPLASKFGAHRKLIDLASHTPSFMPYRAVVLAMDFVERGRELASGGGSSREQNYTLDEVLQRVLDEEDDNQGMPSDEESDLDRQLYDLDNNSR